ncbi:hypothetical protein [Pontibacter liquoris]|nr:hypothetical protein [Pontibacter liquoris]
MRKISTLSSLFLLGTTVSLLMKNWLLLQALKPGTPEDEYHLYL